MQGTKEGLRQFARAFRTGESADFVTKMEQQTQKAVSGIKGDILRTPTLLLTSEDEQSKASSRRMELSGLAVHAWAKKRRRMPGATSLAHASLCNPTAGMLYQAPHPGD